MAMTRHNRWRAQVMLFLTVVILAVTGLINWLLPQGGAARNLRHLLRWIHEGAALGFVALLAVHLSSQWDAIRRSLRRFGLWGKE